MFEKYKDRYEKGWATQEQLKRLVSLDLLTQKEFELIVGD